MRTTKDIQRPEKSLRFPDRFLLLSFTVLRPRFIPASFPFDLPFTFPSSFPRSFIEIFHTFLYTFNPFHTFLILPSILFPTCFPTLFHYSPISRSQKFCFLYCIFFAIGPVYTVYVCLSPLDLCGV